MKLVLITQQGSGSNLFRSIINDHPDIQLHGEIFTKNEKLLQKYSDSGDRRWVISEFIDDFESKKPQDIDIHGFDVKYNNIVVYPEILDELVERDYAVLHLYRCKARTKMRDVNEENESSVSYREFKNYVGWIDSWRARVEKRLSDNWYMTIYYENMTRGREIECFPNAFQDKVLAFLGRGGYTGQLCITDEFVRPEKLEMRY